MCVGVGHSRLFVVRVYLFVCSGLAPCCLHHCSILLTCSKVSFFDAQPNITAAHAERQQSDN